MFNVEIYIGFIAAIFVFHIFPGAITVFGKLKEVPLDAIPTVSRASIGKPWARLERYGRSAEQQLEG